MVGLSIGLIEMAVIYYYSTGHFTRIESELIRALGQYARHNDYVKVGITNEPERRWVEHQRERSQYSDSWTKMVVIYETSSWANVTQAERKLVRARKKCMLQDKDLE